MAAAVVDGLGHEAHQAAAAAAVDEIELPLHLQRMRTCAVENQVSETCTTWAELDG